MIINTIINKITANTQGVWHGQVIDPATSRDQILYGDPEQECTGIITTCWASIDVIRTAIKNGANLIICHEALFWNHGDQREWLEETHNSVYEAKAALLKENHIVVWRNHDHVHSGIPIEDGKYVDGIFYGFAKKLGWENNIITDSDSLTAFQFNTPTTANDVAKHLITRLNLNGARIIGRPDTIVKKIDVPTHILGDAKAQIVKSEKDQFDLFLTLELIDFTLSEYIKDCSELGNNKAIVAVGHFNVEEAGMDYMATYLPNVIQSSLPITYVQSGDLYNYITA